jgi:hypothetical protein
MPADERSTLMQRNGGHRLHVFASICDPTANFLAPTIPLFIVFDRIAGRRRSNIHFSSPYQHLHSDQLRPSFLPCIGKQSTETRDAKPFHPHLVSLFYSSEGSFTLKANTLSTDCTGWID